MVRTPVEVSREYVTFVPQLPVYVEAETGTAVKGTDEIRSIMIRIIDKMRFFIITSKNNKIKSASTEADAQKMHSSQLSPNELFPHKPKYAKKSMHFYQENKNAHLRLSEVYFIRLAITL